VERVAPVPALDSPTAVRVRVKAAALNFFDLLMFVGKYQHKPSFPLVPAVECAGVVMEVGAGVRELAVHSRVYVWLPTGGATCEEIIVDASQCQLLPAPLSFEEGAGFNVGYMTAYHGLVHRGSLKSGETLLVTGAGGGMGVAAVQLGLVLGATVIAAASSDEKLALLKQLGAHHTVNYRTSDLRDEVARITDGKFVDCVYEPVGGDVFKQCVRCMAGNGRLLVIGFASGTIPTIPMNLPLIKGFSIVGVRSGFQLMQEPHLAIGMYKQLHEWATTKGLKPYVGITRDVEDCADAFTAIHEGRVVGKAVITFDSPARPRL